MKAAEDKGKEDKKEDKASKDKPADKSEKKDASEKKSDEAKTSDKDKALDKDKTSDKASDKKEPAAKDKEITPRNRLRLLAELTSRQPHRRIWTTWSCMLPLDRRRSSR